MTGHQQMNRYQLCVIIGCFIAVLLMGFEAESREFESRHVRPEWAGVLAKSDDRPDVSHLARGDALETVKAVNRWANRIRYRDDFTDRWQSPMETVNRNAGDCEDYAILKFFALLDLGIPNDNLRLLWVMHRNEGHMVLAVYLTDWIVLDNLERLPQPLAAYQPMVGMNLTSHWTYIGD